MLKGFKQFILRGNVVDLAVGVVIGASFNLLINSIVRDLLTPFISALFRMPDFSDLSFFINDSEFFYGNLLNSLISFLVVAIAVYFFVVVPVNYLVAKAKKDAIPADPTSKKCPECLSEIPLKAKRCAFCTSVVA